MTSRSIAAILSEAHRRHEAWERVADTVRSRERMVQEAHAFQRVLSDQQALSRIADDMRRAEAVHGRSVAHQAIRLMQQKAMSHELFQQQAWRHAIEDLAHHAQLRAEALGRLSREALMPLGWADGLQASIRANPSLMTRALLATMEPWECTLGSAVVADMQLRMAEFEAQAHDAEALQDIVESVAQVVLVAMATKKKRVDWKFYIGLITSLLMFLYEDAGSRDQGERIARVEWQLLRQEQFLEALTGRTAVRPTPLHLAPKSGSRRIGTIAPGMQLGIIARKGKWAQVVLVESTSDTSSEPLIGWVLNKYLQ